MLFIAAYLAIWIFSGLVLWLTGWARAAARVMGNPGSYEVAIWCGVYGLVILVAASYPWRAVPQR